MPAAVPAVVVVLPVPTLAPLGATVVVVVLCFVVVALAFTTDAAVVFCIWWRRVEGKIIIHTCRVCLSLLSFHLAYTEALRRHLLTHDFS
jgi:hypothetical protein